MARSGVTRRNFLGQCVAVSASTAVPSPCWAAPAEGNAKAMQVQWKSMREDPVRKLFSGQPDLDKILSLFPRPTGYAAFDPQQVAENIRKLQPNPAINTGHPFLDLSVKTGLAFIDLTFQGDRPRYGVKSYGQPIHDAFPPTIIAAVDALSAWGIHGRAKQLFRYWLTTFVRDDGTIQYLQKQNLDGTSIAEFGQLLHTAALLEERSGTANWWTEVFGKLDRIAEHLLRLQAAAAKDDGLIPGVPEADECDRPGKFFHNSAWAAKGLRRWAEVCERQKATPTTAVATVRKAASQLGEDTLRAIRKTWPADPTDWWLPPLVGPAPRPVCLTAGRLASYTNYRYWLELLSADLLPAEMANRLVDARLSAGGQFCGMTRFEGHLDDWPLFDYLDALWSLGRKNDFLLSLYGHIAYHQAEGHLTAYEQVSFPPGKPTADYCLACQLVAARAARRLIR